MVKYGFWDYNVGVIGIILVKIMGFGKSVDSILVK